MRTMFDFQNWCKLVQLSDYTHIRKLRTLKCLWEFKFVDKGNPQNSWKLMHPILCWFLSIWFWLHYKGCWMLSVEYYLQILVSSIKLRHSGVDSMRLLNGGGIGQIIKETGWIIQVYEDIDSGRSCLLIHGSLISRKHK